MWIIQINHLLFHLVINDLLNKKSFKTLYRNRTESGHFYLNQSWLTALSQS